MYVYKPSQIVVMWLLLLTTALLIGAVSNESLNKETAETPAPALPPAPVPASAHGHDIIIDHSDLPTRFGDEDDVIEGKAASEKKTSDNAGIGSSSGKDG